LRGEGEKISATQALLVADKMTPAAMYMRPRAQETRRGKGAKARSVPAALACERRDKERRTSLCASPSRRARRFPRAREMTRQPRNAVQGWVGVACVRTGVVVDMAGSSA